MSKLKKAVFFLLLFAAAVIFILYKADGIASKTYFGKTSDSTLINLDAVEDSSSFNLLLIGTDKSGLMTDAIMLVNVDKSDKKIRLLSIPRDTRVTVDGKRRKINSCYMRGGIDLLLDEVKQLTCAPINYYALIKPGMLADIVDRLGGVEYEVERDMKYSDPSQDLYIDLKAGKQTLNGDMAEQYCRFRSYPMGDLERTEAQKRFFKALLEQKLKLKYTTKIKGIYDDVCKNLETNVTFKDILSNISVMQMLESPDQIEVLDVPGEFNDMKKDGISYYLIINQDLDRLRQLCADNFNGQKNI